MINSSLKCFTIVFLALAVLTVSTKRVDAQQPKGIEKTLQQTHAELVTERQRIEREEKAHQQLLDKLNEKKNTLSDGIVDYKFSIAEKQAQLESLQAQVDRLSNENIRTQRQWSDIRQLCRHITQSLTDFTETLPVSESRKSQHHLLADFKAQQVNNSDISIDVTGLLEAISSLLDESHTSASFTANILIPNGQTKKAHIIRIGHVFHAAKLTDSGKVYLAMTAPGKNYGYRWTDNLNSTTVQNIEKIFALSNYANIACSVPIDPTQQISASDLKKSDTLWQKFRTGGPVMLPLFIVAVLATVIIIERLIFIIPRGRDSVTLAETILANCHQGDFNKAQDIASQSRAPIAKVLNACLLRRNTTAQLMEDAIQEAILHELPRLERFLPTIGILAGIAPLLGLLGTVTGMISTFDMITQLGTGQPRLMAGGISEALLTTATGLVIAIPVLLMHSYLSSRSDRIIADTERYAATLFNLIRDSRHEKIPVEE